ncbi:Transmembrane emp24 domain-containing protein [Quillaja saponaria]|uniref:Transmembrane emp24 domain-containing protein n=1 Tax=Quillaja saponaria TaxID=32244 RepID=A0AAD7L904_QUISA|nr:Transmembrane emp24 domain-containing protein [Quillaja saponaria]
MIQLNLQSLILLLVLVLGFQSSTIESIRFELQSGETKCVSEDIRSNSMTVGKYSIVNPNEGQPIPDSHKVTVRVTSSYGNSYHYSDHVESGQFAFVAVEAGDYMACFWAADHKPQTTLTIDFDWRTGVAAKDWSNVAKKGQVDVMELELKKLYDTVTSIHDEMFYLREREEEMQDLNTATNSKMFWLSFLSLFVSLLVAGLQLWHLKLFFEKKKVI